MEIYIASKNRGKVREFEYFFESYKIRVKSLLDVQKSIEIEETGKTFEENAVIKAKTLAMKLNKIVLADDSGLEVFALNNEPGVYSARYSGIHGEDLANNIKLLNKLKNIKEREAQFVCALALVYPSGKEVVVRGTCQGIIIDDMRGTNGFGYDPIFYIPSLNKTFAELTSAEKAVLSHRGKALRKLKEVFDDY